MQVVTLGKKLIPIEQIAFIEAFDPASNPEFKPERDFKGRVVLLNRDTVLTEIVNRLPNLTPDRRPILTPLSGVFWR
jgi:hypothetical protein